MTKHTLLADRHGVPLAIRTTEANACDHYQLIPLILEFHKIGGKQGLPKDLHEEVYADRGMVQSWVTALWGGHSCPPLAPVADRNVRPTRRLLLVSPQV